MAKRDILYLLAETAREWTAYELQAELSLAAGTVNTQLNNATRQQLLRKRWDGEFFRYSITERGHVRIAYWEATESGET